jgi:hypothetical protein
MPEKKLTPEEIRMLLTQPVDIEALLNHEFEYYVWFRGHSHRLHYQRHEDIDLAIGRFIAKSGAGEAGDEDKLYVFRDFELWLTLHVCRWDQPGSREFAVRNHWLEADEIMRFELDEPEDQNEPEDIDPLES